MPYRPPRRPQLVGHMGYPARAPANTVGSALAAAAAGADMIEIDVSLTSDGHAVAIHGPGLGRTTSGEGRVAKRLWADIASLEVKHAKRHELDPDEVIRVPEVAEILAAVEGASFNLDIKTGRALPPVLELVETFELEDRSVISGATAWSVGRIRRSSVEATALLNLNRFDKVVAATRFGARWLTTRYRRLLTKPDVLALNINHSWVTPSLVERVHALGAQVWAFTVDDQARIDALAAMGVDSITTNVVGDVTMPAS